MYNIDQIQYFKKKSFYLFVTSRKLETNAEGKRGNLDVFSKFMYNSAQMYIQMETKSSQNIKKWYK